MQRVIEKETYVSVLLSILMSLGSIYVVALLLNS